MMNAPKLLSILAACVALAACERDLPSTAELLKPDPATAVTSMEITGQIPAKIFAGITLPAEFRALDAVNRPVAGIGIRFRSTRAPSTLRDSVVVTDSAGIARTQWTLGTAAGEYQMVAEVVRGNVSRSIAFAISEAMADPPRFTQRAIALAGPICAGEAQISGSRSGSIASYSVTNPAVLRAATVQGRTGTFSWMYAGFVAVAPGEGKVIVTDVYGRADTAVVTVGSSLPMLSVPDTLRVAVGDSTGIPATIAGPCAGSMFNPLISTGFYADTVQFRATSLSPELFTAVKHPSMSARIIRGLKPGTGKLVTTFWGGVDTTTVVVR